MEKWTLYLTTMPVVNVVVVNAAIVDFWITRYKVARNICKTVYDTANQITNFLVCVWGGVEFL
jgi:hypothetical protein